MGLLMTKPSTTKVSWTASGAKPGDVWCHPVVWKSTSERQRVPAELGRLVVPENRSDVKSSLIELGFLRFSSPKNRSKSPIIFLVGGPSTENGLHAARDPTNLEKFTQLSQVADVIVLDQRGSGSSAPCLHGIERWNLPLGEPGNRAQILERGRELSHND
jgi:pimeloyl-ACP methyl ester carboxylesterase